MQLIFFEPKTDRAAIGSRLLSVPCNLFYF